ncbi:26S proteasome non-ATPase regulatory subunit 9 [Colletotrichum acutatum]
MDNIHAPTVPSGPASKTSRNGDLGRLSFAELQKKKENMEAELKALGAVLDSVLRTTRARIIHLRNDYKELMAMVEKQLHEHFASLQEEEVPEVPLPGGANNTLADHSASQPLEEPFAKVNTVVPGSPAELAGLKPNDQIRIFGYVNSSNHDSLKKVAECVQGNEGTKRPVLVRVSRPSQGAREELHVTLTPRRNWGGRDTKIHAEKYKAARCGIRSVRVTNALGAYKMAHKGAVPVSGLTAHAALSQNSDGKAELRMTLVPSFHKTSMRVVERVEYVLALKLNEIPNLGFLDESGLPAKACDLRMPEAMGPNLLLKEARKQQGHIQSPKWKRPGGKNKWREAYLPSPIERGPRYDETAPHVTLA